MPSAQRRRALMVASASTIGEERYVTAGGQRIRVNVRHGTGVPLVLCNGIGASLEVLDPLVEQLDPTTVVRFDVPGTGGSPTSLAPYGFPYLAWVLGRVLSKLGIGVVDVLGLSWGGALAQQFAFQNPRRCRRLVLVATGTGAIMVPGPPEGAGENAYPAQVLGSRLRRIDRRRAVRRYRPRTRRRRRATVRAAVARRIEDRLPAPTARGFGLDQPVRAARGAAARP